MSQYRPEFFEPKPVVFLHKNIKNNKKLVIRKRRVGFEKATTILGKRKLVEAFGDQCYNDEARYGQEIPADFFKYNIGHGVK